MALIETHKDLDVYKKSLAVSMEIYWKSKHFPMYEMYSLTDQLRRSSRSVSANISEAWRKRRYEKSFIAKLSDADTEAAETQTWLEYSFLCGYLTAIEFQLFSDEYAHIIGMLVRMSNTSNKWCRF